MLYHVAMIKKGDAKEEITLDDLAAMVQNGFAELRNEFKSDLRSEISGLDKKIDGIGSDVSEIKAELNKKVDRYEHRSLEYRVEKLEKKLA